MNTYTLLQNYWWFIISLLGAILVFLLFVQGGNSMLFTLGNSKVRRTLMVNSTGRKWEFTFTTLVTFGGAFFAAFPLFYSTSFSGAYWLWMIILFSFVLQAVSYEFQSKAGNLFGQHVFRIFLVINGVIGPVFLGVAFGTFFTGSDFEVNKAGITDLSAPVISQWGNQLHGLEALANITNLSLGFAIFFLSRSLAMLYYISSIYLYEFTEKCRDRVLGNAGLFLLFLTIFIYRAMVNEGYAVDPETLIVSAQPIKHMMNFVDMPILIAIFLAGMILFTAGVGGVMIVPRFNRGIWYSGFGAVLVILPLLLSVGYNNTSYYPSRTHMQSSLTLANSCSSEFTLEVMAYASLLIPFVLAYIFYAWRKIDNRRMTFEELDDAENTY